MRWILTFGAAVVALVIPGLASAAPPGNDAFVSATVVSSLPFAETVDITEATRTFEEPVHGCYGTPQRTVWYRIDATSGATLAVRATSTVINDVSIGVFRDTGLGVTALQFVGCGPSEQLVLGACTRPQRGKASLRIRLHEACSLQRRVLLKPFDER